MNPDAILQACSHSTGSTERARTNTRDAAGWRWRVDRSTGGRGGGWSGGTGYTRYTSGYATVRDAATKSTAAQDETLQNIPVSD